MHGDRHASDRSGAQSVVISLDHEGLLWHKVGQGAFHAHPESVEHRSTVGCGDVTVAAFAYASVMNLAAIRDIAGVDADPASDFYLVSHPIIRKLPTIELPGLNTGAARIIILRSS